MSCEKTNDKHIPLWKVLDSYNNFTIKDLENWLSVTFVGLLESEHRYCCYDIISEKIHQSKGEYKIFHIKDITKKDGFIFGRNFPFNISKVKEMLGDNSQVISGIVNKHDPEFEGCYISLNVLDEKLALWFGIENPSKNSD